VLSIFERRHLSIAPKQLKTPQSRRLPPTYILLESSAQTNWVAKRLSLHGEPAAAGHCRSASCARTIPDVPSDQIWELGL
jgi:hypothetical protein